VRHVTSREVVLKTADGGHVFIPAALAVALAVTVLDDDDEGAEGGDGDGGGVGGGGGGGSIKDAWGGASPSPVVAPRLRLRRAADLDRGTPAPRRS